MNDKLIETFLAEAHELVIDLEKALLHLEADQNSKESISAIFRSMHTLKGAAGMFGFDTVNTITHHLESLYQEIRDGNREMSETILRTTFRTLDELRLLLSAANTEPSAEYKELLTTIKELANESSAPTQFQRQTADKKAALESFYVYFLPKENILRNGTNPLYLVDDLLILGKGISLPFFNNLPTDFNAVEPDASYMGFEVLLTTEKSVEEIQSVFLFVDDACEVVIKKLGNTNALKNYTPDSHPWLDRDVTHPVGFEAIFNTIFKVEKDSTRAVVAKKLASHKNANIRVSTERLDDLMNLVSELVTTQARLALYSNKGTSTELSAISENIEKITRRLRDNAFTMSLVPLETIVVRFQRLVSDLSKELDKDIEFKAEGMDTKIDKSIIEKLTDPILHLLRNCIDHGIESGEIRKSVGKSTRGRVQLKSYYSGASVVIEISDDGAGLNFEKIREKAVRQGLIDGHAQPSEKELTELIFVAGFSTASTITGVSGRGVGMDVVKRNISDIRGEIEVHSRQGIGTTFSVRLPLTLSILDGLLVKIGQTDFVLPLTSVAKCYEAETAALESSYNNWVTLEGKRTPFIFLRQNFEISDNKPRFSQIINVPFNGSHVGIVVDKIEGEYQAVLKPLGHYYQQQDEFSGATILGNGTVALVLDPNKLIRKLTNNNN